MTGWLPHQKVYTGSARGRDAHRAPGAVHLPHVDTRVPSIAPRSVHATGRDGALGPRGTL